MNKNNNTSIAKKLGLIYQEINEIDKSDSQLAVLNIQQALQKIEVVAQENEASILRAIIHWMSLNTEIDENNKEQIDTLIFNESYSNWIDVLATLLYDYNFALLPELHQSLTSPDWIIHPSSLLLKDLASWLNQIQSDEEINADNLNTLVNNSDKSKNIQQFKNIVDEDSGSNVINLNVNSIDKLISSQIEKAEEAKSEILDHRNAFEKIERDTLDHEYLSTDSNDDFTEDTPSKNSINNILIDNHDMSIDEELFSQNETLVESFINTEDLQSKEDQINLLPIKSDLEEIYQHLKSSSAASSDVFLAKDSYNKQLERISILTSGTPLEIISIIVDWCQRNIILFESNPTNEIKTFIRSGNVWSWLKEIHGCFDSNDKNVCITKLADSLTSKEWLEPIDSNDLKTILLNISNTLNDETLNDAIQNTENNENNTHLETRTIDSNELIFNVIVSNNLDSPELIDNTSPVETAEIAYSDEVEMPNFQFTWEDTTHPELLLVYLEETPRNINELVPLLNKISINETSNDETIIASRLAHTVKGGSAIVGITALSEFCSKLETILDFSRDNELDTDILEILPNTGKCLQDLFDSIQYQSDAPSDFIPIYKILEKYESNIDTDDFPIHLDTKPELPNFITQDNNPILDSSPLMSNTSIEDNLMSVESNDQEIPQILDDDVTKLDIKASEQDIQVHKQYKEKSDFQITWNDDTHPELLVVYLEETPTQISTLVPLMNKISNGTANADEKYEASRMAHTIKGGSAIVGITVLSEISYRLETLLDHSVKNQLPQDLLNLLPEVATCLEEIFEAIQLQEDEPEEYFSIFKKLEQFVNSIEENDDPLELVSPALPDFILNQNLNNETSSIVEDKEALLLEATEVNSITENNLVNEDDLVNEDNFQIENHFNNKTNPDNNKEELITDDHVIKTVSVEPSKLEKLGSEEDIDTIVIEINDIVMNLVTIKLESTNQQEQFEKYSLELERFDLLTEISGYPELSLVTQWCRDNIELSLNGDNDNFNKFIQSDEIWSWVEFVAAALNDSDDMSHLSSLSVELMRDDWLKAINMDDLQAVLLSLRNYDSVDITNDAEYVTDLNDESDQDISWDKDIHPELLAVYFKETPDQISEVAELLQKISRSESTPEENKKAARIAHTIKGASGVIGLNALLELTHSLEDILDYSVSNNITEETAELLAEASDCMESLFEAIQNKQPAPEELQSILVRLSDFTPISNELDDSSNLLNSIDQKDEVIIEEQQKLSIKTLSTADTDVATFNKKPNIQAVDINEAHIRVPIRIIDKLLNLAGELVTKSSQVSDDLNNSLATNKSIKVQDGRVNNMLEELSNTITQQEKDQHKLLSSIQSSDFDTLEMDSYNELHSVASLLSESFLDSQEIDNTLTSQLNGLSDKLRSLDKINKEFSDLILSSRMISVNTIIPRLERIVRQTCRKTNKKAQLKVTGNNINIDSDILNGLIDPLLHMLRNSIDHGIENPTDRIKQNKEETGLIELKFTRDGNNILMSLKDDGAGINTNTIYQKALEKNLIKSDQELTKRETLKLIFEPGFTTQNDVTDISGRGVGMDVVKTSVQSLNGSIKLDSIVGKGSTFDLTIPLTLITNNTLLVKAAGNTIAIPIDTIEQIIYQEANKVIEHDGSHFIIFENNELEIKSLGHLLEWSNEAIDFSQSYNVLIVRSQNKFYAIQVDNIISSREVVVKTLNPWISASKGVVGACHLNDGGVAPVVNMVTIVRQAKANVEHSLKDNKVNDNIQTVRVTPKILVVDDSLSNRKALSLIIDKTEYDVLTAVDGMDALQIMNENTIDLIFTDLEMPRMNGIELTQAIRSWTNKSKTPIVMITSRTTKKHRELAHKAGVDDYLTKPVVTDKLLDSINRWLAKKETVEA